MTSCKHSSKASEARLPCVNGAATESFHLADMGLSAIGPEAREEVFALFPDLRADISAYGPTARACLRGREARLLAA